MPAIHSLIPCDRCIRVDEVCQRLGVSRTSLWRLMKAKEIAPTRFGGRLVFRESVIAEFIEQHTERPKKKSEHAA